VNKFTETFEAMLGAPAPGGASEVEPGGDGAFPDAAPPGPDEPTLSDAVDEWIRTQAQGVIAMPTYISDLVMKNLSLTEQSVFHRLFRLAGGLIRPTPRIRPSHIGQACGLRPRLVAAAVRGLVEKGLVTISRRNPLTGSARFSIGLPATVSKTGRICCVCHGLIDETDRSRPWLPVPLSIQTDGAYQYVAAHSACIEGATL
jgi:hypothetical protein